MTDDLVLVTGASGFIAKHIVLDAIRAGYRVRGTVRDVERKGAEVTAVLRAAGVDASRFEPVPADLLQDAGWDEAAAGCRFVLHTASPFPQAQPRDKFGLVPAAKGGTLRVLEAARAAGVERVVLTSSVASVFYGHPDRGERPFGEADFSNVESAEISPYAVSKTMAELAAWECLRGSATELATINPSLVFGPALDGTVGTSLRLLSMMMNKRLPMLPNVAFGIVDVRDVAAAHLAAMTEPAAKGRRFVVSAETRTLLDMAATVGRSRPAFGRRVTRRRLPSVLIKAAALISPSARMLAAEIDRVKCLDTTPAVRILGLRMRSGDEAILSAADSLVTHGLV